MIDKNEMAKLGLAFAVGVSLSAGYVMLGVQLRTPDVVVVQERCPEADEGLERPEPLVPEGIELAPLRGEERVPEGFSLWIGLDGMGLENDPLLALEGGRFAEADVERHSIRALAPIAHERASSSSTAVLWIDHRVPGATLIDVIYTLERAGFHDFALAVAGAGGPEVFRFESQVFGSFVGIQDEPWKAALSLRLEQSGLSAWLTPRSEGKPSTEAPAPLAVACRVTMPIPEMNLVAGLEHDLCQLQGAPLAVEFVISPERSVGELLAMRAADARSDACRGPSNLVASELPACERTMPMGDALTRFTDAARLNDPDAVKATVEGALDKEQVREVVKAHIDEVRDCYNEGLMNDAELEGKVIVDFVIDERGKVVETSLDGRTDLPDRNAARCIANAVSDWKFPTSEQGEVKVTYPFMLSPG